MCCGAPTSVVIPTSVAEMLAEYGRLAAVDGQWGEGPAHTNAWYLRQLRFLPMDRLFGEAVGRMIAAHPDEDLETWIREAWGEDFDEILRDCLDGAVPEGLVALRITDDGAHLDHGPGATAHPIIDGDHLVHELLVDSRLERSARVTVDGQPVEVPAGGARLALVELTHDRPHLDLAVDDVPIDGSGVGIPAETAWLWLSAGVCARWSVTDASGAGWFPDGALTKWDHHRRPFFHGDDIAVAVPAGEVAVRVARGLEYAGAETTVRAAAGEETPVELAPTRWVDPAAHGWYGADLHVHMNYAGELVCAPEDAARMQFGEGLALMNLTAGNCTTSRIFDREALEAWVGEDLAWSTEDVIARMGVEYRNDLLGHVHALGLQEPPTHYHSGHAGSDAPEDWPANAVACRELADLGATVGYCHPVMLPLDDDARPDSVFSTLPRSVECREVVADAALGLVDSIDVISNMSNRAAGVLHRRLLGAGVALAVTAGTDCFLSFASCATFSNPPGWGRVYAHLDGPLSVDAFQDAIRRGATIATNGPWISLDVDGAGPGDRLDVRPGTTVRARAHAHGPGVEELRIYCADGVLGTVVPGDDGSASVDLEVRVGEPSFIVAVAEGGEHPAVLDAETSGFTSAVHVDVDGRSVARADDARWCLRWLDLLEDLVRTQGTYHDPAHLDDVVAVIDEARTVYADVVDGLGP